MVGAREGGEKPTLLVKNAAQATTTGGPTYAFVRPQRTFFNGDSLVLATPDGFRTVVEARDGIFEPKMSPDESRIAYADETSSTSWTSRPGRRRRSPRGAWPRGSMTKPSSWPPTTRSGTCTER